MNALWLENNQVTYRRDIRQPYPKPGEALIRIRLAGICSTDLELVKGYYPYTGVLGHEFVGEVVEAPGNSHLINQRVVGEINIACGECESCLSGQRTHCKNRSVLGIVNHDGVFAEYTILPVKNLYHVPPELSDERAVFTEPLAAALEIQQQVQIYPSDRILLIGAGRLGQLIARSLTLTGCSLWVLARHEKSKDLLSGLTTQVLSSDELEGAYFDVVVEATGSPDGFYLARKAVRPRGKIILKSTYHGELKIDMSKIVVDEIQLIGSRCGPFQPALNLLTAELVDPTCLIDQRFPLSSSVEAMRYAASPGIMKVLIYPD